MQGVLRQVVTTASYPLIFIALAVAPAVVSQTVPVVGRHFPEELAVPCGLILAVLVLSIIMSSTGA